jgi:hypothetical protein
MCAENEATWHQGWKDGRLVWTKIEPSDESKRRAKG